MTIRVRESVHDLADDMAAITRRARKDMVGVVREGIKVGASVARDYARDSAGAHGKHYPKSITSEMLGIADFGGVADIAGEYGPDASKPQGNMSFEHGSRNQPPHLDLARSADVIAPAFVGEVRRLPDKWFW